MYSTTLEPSSGGSGDEVEEAEHEVHVDVGEKNLVDPPRARRAGRTQPTGPPKTALASPSASVPRSAWSRLDAGPASATSSSSRRGWRRRRGLYGTGRAKAKTGPAEKGHHERQHKGPKAVQVGSRVQGEPPGRRAPWGRRSAAPPHPVRHLVHDGGRHDEQDGDGYRDEPVERVAHALAPTRGVAVRPRPGTAPSRARAEGRREGEVPTEGPAERGHKDEQAREGARA